MRKRIVFAAILLTAVFLMAACQEKTKTPSPAEPTAPKSKESEERNLSISVSYQGDGRIPASDILFADRYETRTDIPLTLEDTMGSAFRGSRDTIQDSRYHVFALDLDLAIPEGCFFSVLPGLFLDGKGREATLEFVDMYVLTQGKFETEELATKIREIKKPDPHGDALYVYDTKDIPEEILSYFYVFRSEYTAFSGCYVDEFGQVFSGIRTDSAYSINLGAFRDRNEWRVSGSWLVGDTGEENAPGLKTMEETLAGVTTEDPGFLLRRYRECYELAEQFPLLLIDAARTCHAGNTGILITYGLYSLTSVWLKNPDCTPFNEIWTEAYREAEKELSESPEGYLHEFRHLAFEPAGVGVYDGFPELNAYEASVREGWYQDEEHDQALRARAYANLQAVGRDVSLKDIAIVFRDFDEERAYLIFLRDSASGELVPVEKGVDDATRASQEMDFMIEYTLNSREGK